MLHIALLSRYHDLTVLVGTAHMLLRSTNHCHGMSTCHRDQTPAEFWPTTDCVTALIKVPTSHSRQHLTQPSPKVSECKCVLLVIRQVILVDYRWRGVWRLHASRCVDYMAVEAGDRPLWSSVYRVILLSSKYHATSEPMYTTSILIVAVPDPTQLGASRICLSEPRGA